MSKRRPDPRLARIDSLVAMLGRCMVALDPRDEVMLRSDIKKLLASERKLRKLRRTHLHEVPR